MVIAHVGGGNGFLNPLIGIDHLIAMLAIGIWSAQIWRQSYLNCTVLLSVNF